MEKHWLDYGQFAVTVVALLGAVWTYYKSTVSQNAKQLSELWQRFYTTPEFAQLFDLMDQIETQPTTAGIDHLKQTPSEIKLRFAAYLSEVWLFADSGLLLTNKSRYLFQWHFYFLYGSSKGKYAFWSFLGENNDAIDRELSQAYWSRYLHFTQKVIVPMLQKPGQ